MWNVRSLNDTNDIVCHINVFFCHRKYTPMPTYIFSFFFVKKEKIHQKWFPQFLITSFFIHSYTSFSHTPAPRSPFASRISHSALKYFSLFFFHSHSKISAWWKKNVGYENVNKQEEKGCYLSYSTGCVLFRLLYSIIILSVILRVLNRRLLRASKSINFLLHARDSPCCSTQLILCSSLLYNKQNIYTTIQSNNILPTMPC